LCFLRCWGSNMCIPRSVSARRLYVTTAEFRYFCGYSGHFFPFPFCFCGYRQASRASASPVDGESRVSE
jgi:hypothetical protein